MRIHIRHILFAGFIFVGIALIMASCGDDTKVASPTPTVVDGDTIPAVWKVEIAHDTGVILGQFYDVDITLSASSAPMGGFDLLMTFADSALTFVQAEQGQYFIDCGWEYFTYRLFHDNDCPDCPRSFVRLVGLAETNNGAIHPDIQCITAAAGQVLATVTFYVRNDRFLECTRHPIQFYWYDCGDNTISTYGGDSLALDLRIYDTDSTRIEDSLSVFPGFMGAPDSSCFVSDVTALFRGIDFVNGGVDIICADSIDLRGDLNVNGIRNEIADAVLFTEYFIQGITVFDPHVVASTAASDVNGDGETLTLADLAYLIRIIQGDAMPFPPQVGDTTASISVHNGQVSLASPIDVGAVRLVFDLNAVLGEPTLIAPDMSMKYGIYSGELRVLIYDIGSFYIPKGNEDILIVPATATLISAEAAGYDGNNTIHVAIDPVP